MNTFRSFKVKLICLLYILYNNEYILQKKIKDLSWKRLEMAALTGNLNSRLFNIEMKP